MLLLGEGAQAAAELGVPGDDVVDGPGAEHPDAADAGGVVELQTVEECRQPAGRLGGRQHHVALAGGEGGVPAGPAQPDGEALEGGHGDPGAGHHQAGGQVGGEVEAGHALDPEPVEHTALEHRSGPLAGLLGGLEEQDDPAGEPGRPLRQHRGGAEQGGGVAVVPAGVHHPGDARAEGKAGLLLDGKGVDVGAEQDGAAPAAALEAEDRPRGGGAGQLLEPQGAQPPADQ